MLKYIFTFFFLLWILANLMLAINDKRGTISAPQFHITDYGQMTELERSK